MTGLDPEVDRILEIAIIITGPDLTPRIEGPVLVIHQSNMQLDGMDAWNKGTHGKSGLIERVKSSTTTEAQAQHEMLNFLSQYLPSKISPMCGNSIGQDRRFLAKYMPKLEVFFTTETLMSARSKSWPSAGVPMFTRVSKKQRHTALADVHESIDEMAHYRSRFLRLSD